MWARLWFTGRRHGDPRRHRRRPLFRRRFGTFGALDGKLFADEVDFERDWLDDARRYLTNIVGKYGPHIQLLLKKAGGVLDQIKYICRSTAPCGARIWLVHRKVRHMEPLCP